MAEKKVLLMLADISGYTGFMTAHRKALAHGQMIITELLQTLIAQIESPLEISKLEGDAVFLYAVKEETDGVWEGARARIGSTFLRFFEVFSDRLRDLTAASVCSCHSCANIDKLRLKLIVHSGDALFYKIGNFFELSGVDVIIAHRLLKNSVGADQYILLTEPAYQDVHFPERIDRVGEEEYDAIEKLRTYVHFPGARAGSDGTLHLPPTRVTGDILRYEIRRKYVEVANNPNQGFHFHTGRPLAKLLGYRDDWLAGLPEGCVESMAGTGCPFSMGELHTGARVVDIGCGAGVDTLIAARMVGPAGRVVGVDMTPEMLAKARAGAQAVGAEQVELRSGQAESLPVEDGWADAVISNGVLNLCPDKTAVYREIFRVLKPGGRMQIGDILVEKPIPEEARRDSELWTD